MLFTYNCYRYAITRVFFLINNESQENYRLVSINAWETIFVAIHTTCNHRKIIYKLLTSDFPFDTQLATLLGSKFKASLCNKIKIP